MNLLHLKVCLYFSFLLSTACALSPKPRRSVEKCTEYANADYIYDGQAGSKNCALPELNNLFLGSAVEPKEFPHLALIGYRDSEDNKAIFPCMGSLLSENYVLIVAHCTFHPQKGPPNRVLLGDFSKNPSIDGNTQEIDIETVIPHPDYTRRKRINDIALIKLKKPATLNSHIRPACLYHNKNISQTKGLYAAQINQDESINNVQKTELVKTKQDILPNQKCLDVYRKALEIDDGHLCIGTNYQRRNGNCMGESGSPLVVASQLPCMYEIVGLAAYGMSCGMANIPEVDTNVPYHLDWIENIVWPVDDDQAGWTWPDSKLKH